MRRRVRYLVLIMLLTLSMIAASGCGVDMSKAAGSVSNAAAEESREGAEDLEEVEEDVVTDMSQVLYDESEFLKGIPAWDGETPYCEVNGNVPDLTEQEIWTSTQESLDPLDALGRCGSANSCIGLDGMPTEPRGDISEIHPTGWHTDSYEGVEGEKLYNRCHLIAHKLSGDDAVARNLITGTSYMNRDGMLPFEDQIEEYVKGTGNHVMYRVTPCFVGEELVARGVHMQAVSVEDDGEGLAFNVFCYNVQPGIYIDYMTGDNMLAEEAAALTDGSEQTEQNGLTDGTEQTEESKPADGGEETAEEPESEVQAYVLNNNTKKFHYPSCGSVDQIADHNRQDVEDTRENLMAKGYKPCGNCHP